MSKKVKPVAGKNLSSGKTIEPSFDLAPMREHIDGLKKDVATLPEGKTKTSLMKKLEAFYFWTGNYVQGLANDIGGRTASANA